VSVVCPANLVTGPGGVPACVDGSGGAVAWVQTIPFDFTQLDVPTLAAVFGVGFTIIGMCWFLGKAVGIVVNMVKNA
jgi:hypothetical protein